MAKKKLTKGQQRQIKANHDKKLHTKVGDSKIQWQDEDLGPTKHGTVISRFGQHADVESDDGVIYRCNLRRSISSLAVSYTHLTLPTKRIV